MRENEPLMVTILCLVYNHESYIRQCLEGFVMQKTNFRFEAIVHDDASTDGTAAIIREYAEKYPDIIKPIFVNSDGWNCPIPFISIHLFAPLTLFPSFGTKTKSKIATDIHI